MKGKCSKTIPYNSKNWSTRNLKQNPNEIMNIFTSYFPHNKCSSLLIHYRTQYIYFYVYSVSLFPSEKTIYITTVLLNTAGNPSFYFLHKKCSTYVPPRHLCIYTYRYVYIYMYTYTYIYVKYIQQIYIYIYIHTYTYMRDASAAHIITVLYNIITHNYSTTLTRIDATRTLELNI